MTVAIVDYGSGNLHSAAKAFERAADGEAVLVTNDADAVAKADRVVLPGVGAFGDCKAGLAAVPGMIEALEEAVVAKGRPFFGICVGMQLMASWGREHGDTEGLGWIPGEVVALEPGDPNLKIPHMGWNDLQIKRNEHELFADLPDVCDVYFVHSFGMTCEHAENVLATVDYGGPVTAVVGRDNMIGSQFHPEKSQAVGLSLISNFLRWKP